MVEYLVPAEADLERLEHQLVEQLGVQLSCDDEPSRPVVERVYYDTFDGRIYRAGLALLAERADDRSQIRLVARGPDERQRSCSYSSATMPRFAWDLPPSRLRSSLETIIEMRALLPQATIRSRERRFSKHDDYLKTVARLALEEHRLVVDGHATALDARVRVEPLKGYGKAHRQITRSLTRELRFSSAEDDLLTTALARLGTQLDGYSSKVALILEPTMRADEATKQVLRQLLGTMDANIDGMCHDVDSEFLHDFRVAIRRTRTALSRMRGVFPSRRVERFKRDLRWLGRQTGPARDLDVYLLDLDGMKARLPTELGVELEPLRGLLKQHKTAAYGELVKAITGARGHKLLADWRAFVRAEVPRRSSLPHACAPISEVARSEIWRAYRKVLRQGRAVDDAAPAMQLHDLRKACKALRYLMEFFRSLFPDAAVARQIAELKLLQSILGEVQDFEVQTGAIGTWAVDLATQPQASASTMMALGALGEQLRGRQDETRQRFAATFKRYGGRKNRSLARELFRPRPSRKQP